jgi:hypothetical protein
MENYAKENSDFVRTIYLRINGKVMTEQCQKEAIWDMAYEDSQEEDTVYLKLDDDVVYLEESLFTDFIQARIDNPEPPLMFPLIVNNTYGSWLLQNKNIISSPFPNHFGENWKHVYKRIQSHILNHIPRNPKEITKLRIGDFVTGNEILCPVGWGNIHYCVDIHSQFIQNLSSQTPSNFTSTTHWGDHVFHELTDCEPMSINACSWLGSSLKNYTAKYGPVYHDENWWTVYLPTWTHTRNRIYTKTIVSHYAFYRQRELGLDNTDILDKYWKLCYTD